MKGKKNAKKAQGAKMACQKTVGEAVAMKGNEKKECRTTATEKVVRKRQM